LWFGKHTSHKELFQSKEFSSISLPFSVDLVDTLSGGGKH